jgi:signal transduction histidine kinase
VAYQWRIRHKLLLGLGLVEGLMGLLLAGTLIGLLSYHWTMKSIGSKLDELNAAETLKEATTQLVPLNPHHEVEKLRKEITNGESALDAYETRLANTVTRGRDPDEGYYEGLCVGALHKRLEKLKAELAKRPVAQEGGEDTGEMRQYRTNVEGAVKDLVDAAGDLCNAINDKLKDRISDSHTPYLLSMWIVLSTSGVGGLLMIGLLRFFYGWIFHPIRDLEQGVNRVARGDFEHRIELHSGDEMEELAAAFNDMTNRLDEMYRDLAHQVNERSRQLVRSERLASVGFLAAGVAHEINNPLASIAFCSEALESRLATYLAEAPKDGEVVTKYLRMIQQEAFRCKAITQRLLEFSRGGERRREATDLAELIQGVLDMVQHLQNIKGKEILFEPVERLVAFVNSQEVKSVVLNLVINALDSMDEGGTLTITLREHDRMAELVFADTGCGMSPDILENIFEPFFTRSRTGKGTGLGLAISHRAITQHGGEIEAASPGLNGGSTFTVRLPLQPAESSKEESIGRAAA